MLSKQEIIKDTEQLPLLIYYQGNYEEIPTESIVEIIEANEMAAKRKSHLRKVMFLSVEAIQNVQRYSAHQDHRSDFYLLFYDVNSYQIVTQNLIENKNCEELKQRLDTLITKDLAQLEELYMARVESEEQTEKGSGLGLIEIARKSNKTMRYEFKEVNEQFSLFKLYFRIPITQLEGSYDFSKAIDIQNKLLQFSNDSQSSFYYAGDFSNTFILSLLNLLVSKKAEEKNNANKKVHHILIELIQNIKKHAREENKMVEGKIFIEWKREFIDVSTYNVALTEHAGKLQRKVVDLNSASKEELLRKSKDMLADMESTNGLGLIDVANLTHPNKIELNIHKESDEFSELLFNLRINNE
jgi:hypothetical protein